MLHKADSAMESLKWDSYIWIASLHFVRPVMMEWDFTMARFYIAFCA
ncbi:hypothetical protein [Helicobacter sp. MIT 05-5294]|nr:hypothetical protein [Helicobacter sp. MIT 05-5294]